MNSDTLIGLTVGLLLTTLVAHLMACTIGWWFPVAGLAVVLASIACRLPSRFQNSGLPELLLIAALGSLVISLLIVATN